MTKKQLDHNKPTQTKQPKDFMVKIKSNIPKRTKQVNH